MSHFLYTLHALGALDCGPVDTRVSLERAHPLHVGSDAGGQPLHADGSRAYERARRDATTGARGLTRSINLSDGDSVTVDLYQAGPTWWLASDSNRPRLTGHGFDPDSAIAALVELLEERL